MRGKYLFPINSGQQNYLAGTVGEIRASHFHTGIDIKTGGRIGLPVHATTDGYISRIKISAVGYGHVLYMQHLDGNISVYAHLDSFNEELQNWIVAKQYELESFEIDLFPTKNRFFYKKGGIIGYSGNTGSSSGPHLHFEIRDENNLALDALKFNFSEISDRKAPVVKKIAFVTMDENARVNGYFGRYEFELSLKDGVYVNTSNIHLLGKIGVEIYSYDPMDGIHHKNGIVKTTLKVDDELKFEEHKTQLPFSKQRNALVHYNYAAFKKGRKKFNKLYLSDGNEHTFYTTTNRGIYFSSQTSLEIKTEDSYGNKSTSVISLTKGLSEHKPWVAEIAEIGNFLHIKSNQTASVQVSEWVALQPYKKTGEDRFYIWDLRNGSPKSIFLNGKTVNTGYRGIIPPAQERNYVQKEFDLSLSGKSLFDTLFLAFEKKYDSTRNLELFQFKNAAQPLRTYLTIKLKPEKKYGEKAAVYSSWGKKLNYIGGDWEKDKLKFKTRDLVTYTIVSDTVSPIIIPKVINSEVLKFQINDSLSGIKSFRAELNGDFVLMYYNQKRNLIYSEKLDKNIPFEGEFSLELIDNSNNKATYSIQL